MTNYSLTVKIQNRSAVQHFAQQGYKLCFASGVEREGRSKVIALATNIGPNIQVRWNDDFGIAAGRSGFMDRGQVEPTSDIDYIRLGQIYTLNPDFYGGVNDGGPQGGIRFNNQADNAAPIIYRNIGGSMAPIYVGSRPLPRGASQEIKPNNRVTVWFQQDVEGGTMIDGINEESFEIDMSGKISATVVLNEGGTWSLQ